MRKAKRRREAGTRRNKGRRETNRGGKGRTEGVTGRDVLPETKTRKKLKKSKTNKRKQNLGAAAGQ